MPGVTLQSFTLQPIAIAALRFLYATLGPAARARSL